MALSSGITTLVAMGLGGVWDVGVNPGHNLDTMARAWRDIPLNVAFLARGSASHPALLERALQAGASGFKVHEDFGAYPAIVDTCLTVAEEADAAVALHTDSLNESGLLADTLSAIAGRAVHAYHIEGSGGGHPRLFELVSQPHVTGSSTTPTLPFAVNTLSELVPMTMTVHRQSPAVASDVAVSGAGSAGPPSKQKTSCTTWERSPSSTPTPWAWPDRRARAPHLAAGQPPPGRTNPAARARAPDGHAAQAPAAGQHGADNERVLRYLAKLTINPALAHGLAGHVGSLEPGKLADIVLWHPAFFGAKPELVLKSEFVAWGVSGDGAGSTRLGQPRNTGPTSAASATRPPASAPSSSPRAH